VFFSLGSALFFLSNFGRSEGELFFSSVGRGGRSSGSLIVSFLCQLLLRVAGGATFLVSFFSRGCHMSATLVVDGKWFLALTSFLSSDVS